MTGATSQTPLTAIASSPRPCGPGIGKLDEAQLERYGLPVWKTDSDVAAALGVSEKELRFFACHRSVEKVCHYVRFAIPKRSGGERIIMAP